MHDRAVNEVLARGRARRTWRSEPAAIAQLVRTRAGLTQAELAAVLGVDRSAVSRWESGARAPRAAVLTRYMDLLDRIKAGPHGE